jgi:hypothetical protein
MIKTDREPKGSGSQNADKTEHDCPNCGEHFSTCICPSEASQNAEVYASQDVPGKWGFIGCDSDCYETREEAEQAAREPKGQRVPETRELREAYDISNVDFRNLLSVVMGRLSNQTGESFDAAMLRSKSADEILRRYKAVEEQRDSAQIGFSKLAQAYDQILAERDELLAACIWIRDVVKERKGTAHWLQMVEDKARAAIAKAEKGAGQNV